MRNNLRKIQSKYELKNWKIGFGNIFEKILKNECEISEKILIEYISKLKDEEKSEETMKKYERDIKKLIRYLESKNKIERIEKHDIIEYKESLKHEYEITSINSMIVAINGFFRYINREDLCVKQYKMQKKMQIEEKKLLTETEYQKLVKTAYSSGDKKLRLIVEVLGCTGIRVSELKFITVENINKNRIRIELKGKIREFELPKELVLKLKGYIEKENIDKGEIFISKKGKGIDRTYVWRKLKELGKKAGVDSEKVFPHNIRHLFARAYYKLTKDLVMLSDILGHSSINTTRIYTKVTAREMKIDIKKLGLSVATE